jgi:hypothetical protein
LNLIVESQAGIVLHMQGLDGNMSDKTAFCQTIKEHIKQLQTVQGLECIVMDSAGYTKESLVACGTSLNWTSRVPETLAESKAALAKSYDGWSLAAIEFRIRQALILLNLTLPNQLGKQVKNPTARWIFACFTPITVLYINQNPKTLNLNELHRKVIGLFGEKYHKYYYVI